MGAAFRFDNVPQLGHYLVMRQGLALVVKRRLNFRSKPAIVRFGFCNRGELGLDRGKEGTHGLLIIRQAVT
jgi:hypothetical protein